MLEERYFIFPSVFNLERCKPKAPYSHPATTGNLLGMKSQEGIQRTGPNTISAELLKSALPVVNPYLELFNHVNQ